MSAISLQTIRSVWTASYEVLEEPHLSPTDTSVRQMRVICTRIGEKISTFLGDLRLI